MDVLSEDTTNQGKKKKKRVNAAQSHNSRSCELQFHYQKDKEISTEGYSTQKKINK